MGVPQTGSPSPETVLGRIAKVLRAQSEHVTHEELPKRWIDLLLHLDEQERRQVRASQHNSQTRMREFRRPSLRQHLNLCRGLA